MTHRFLFLSVGLLLTAATVDAHHSFARMYFEEKEISLEGAVVSYDYRNPHTWVYFTAKDPTGVSRRYGAEWSNPRRLGQQGVVANTLRAGDFVIVTGAPNRNSNDYTVHLKTIRRPADGWSWPGGGSR